MTGKEQLFELFEKATASTKADGVEIAYVGSSSGLTRYANSTIHQNMNEDNNQVYVRVIRGKKIGVALSNSLKLNDMRAAIKNAMEIAKFQKPNEHFPGLAGPQDYKKIDTYDEATVKFGPKERARAIKQVFVRANRRKFLTAGSFAITDGEIAVFNTNGVRCYQQLTSANLQVIAMSDTSAGYGVGLSRRVAEIDPVAIADTAVDKAFRSKKPKAIKAGEYEVILEPSATSAIFEWVNYIGFGSKAFHDQTSFLTENIGKKVMDDAVTIYDDGNDTSALAMPFDFEGMPKKRVYFVEKGIGKGVVYDRTSANRNGAKSTGHALTPDSQGEGAVPLNLFIAPGKDDTAKMIASVEKGILVTRFHYINGFIDTPKAVLTGMTRDGTFLIKNGKIQHGIKNLRFTDSMLRAFSTVKGVSKEAKLVPSWWDSVGCISAPAFHLGSFKFTGTTDF